jgi:hypothetical protein
MTLWLPALDYARSPRPLIERIATLLPSHSCVLAPELSPPGVAALEVIGHWRVDARPNAASDAAKGACPYLLRTVHVPEQPAPPPGWTLIDQVQRPTDREEVTQVFRRASPP